MCGIFGAVGPSLDREAVVEAGVQAARRGPHGWGVALVTTEGVHVHRERGQLTDKALRHTLMEVPGRLRAVIGHGRLATGLNVADPDAYQPITVGTWAVVHNGTVRNYEDLVKEYDLDLRTSCDSEVIAHLAHQGFAWAVEQLSYESPHAILATDTGTLWAARCRGHTTRWWKDPQPVVVESQPLYQWQDDERNVYLCSRQVTPEWSELPGEQMTAWEIPVIHGANA